MDQITYSMTTTLVIGGNFAGMTAALEIKRKRDQKFVNPIAIP